MRTPCLLSIIATLLFLPGTTSRAGELPNNTWTKVTMNWKAALPTNIVDAGWSTTDGYSDNVYRARTGTIIIRTGVRSKRAGLRPGYYTNASVEWDLRTDSVRTIDIANWGGGSYGGGKLLPAFKDHPTPSPRHTYDGICYVAEEDALYMMQGANWKIGSKGDDEAKTALALDGKSTWKYTFANSRWTRIDGSIRQFWNGYKASPYESHMTHWRGGGKLLYLDSNARCYAEFDLKTQKWAKVVTANKCPMSLYNARSTWDTKRGLWVHRLGPRVCTFDPKEKTFTALPNCYDLKIPTREERKQMKKEKKKPDPRLGSKGICYISKHDRYLVCGPTGHDTALYNPETKTWTSIKGGNIKLINGYMQYDPKLDIVAMNYQHQTYKFKFKPE